MSPCPCLCVYAFRTCPLYLPHCPYPLYPVLLGRRALPLFVITIPETQVPDGEFLCPKCKTDEAAAPPLTPSKATAHQKGSSVGQSGGGPHQSAQANGPASAGEHGGPAVDAGGSVAAARGVGTGAERTTGVGVGVAGISMLATDGSTVDLTQIAM